MSTEMDAEAKALSRKLEEHILNLRQVEAALELEPAHVELIKLKADLNELIELTRQILCKKLASSDSSKNVVALTRGPISNVGTVGSTSADTTSSSKLASYMPSSSGIHPAAMFSSIKGFGDAQYKDFIIQALDDERPPEILQQIVKYVSNHVKKHIGRRMRRDAKGRADDGDSDGENKGSSSKKEGSRSAWHAPLIYRGDILSVEEDVLFLTVKQIRLKPTIYSDHKMVAGVVCIVNSQKVLTFWSIINWKPEDICQTFTGTTGITSEKLQKGLPFNQVLSLLIMAIAGKPLVGYNLEESLQALSISHDRKLDLRDYFCDSDGPFSFDDLRQSLKIGFNGNCSNELDANGESNSIAQEARVVRDLHAWMTHHQNVYSSASFTETPEIESVRKRRSESTVIKDRTEEICRCSL